MTKYVTGFLIDKTLNLIVLIEKLNPFWQKYKWNGIGGKIENTESSLDAMRREFQEEAGVEINDWTQFCTLSGPDFEVIFFFTTVDSEKMAEIKTLTEEKVSIWSIQKILLPSFPLLSNVRWILPMAIESIRHKKKETYNISILEPENL